MPCRAILATGGYHGDAELPGVDPRAGAPRQLAAAVASLRTAAGLWAA